jgi:hypothetical protein
MTPLTRLENFTCMISAIIFSTNTVPLERDLFGIFFLYSMAVGVTVYIGLWWAIIVVKNYTGGDW